MDNEYDTDLVSVIIPTYKRPDMLGRAINSVLNQTYDNIEIIVVDDNHVGSKYRKETEDFMKKYCDVDNLFYLKHNKNKGGSAARNTGIRNSNGELIAFLDDDDEWLEDKLEKQVNVLKKLSSEFAAVYCPFIKYRDNDKLIIPETINEDYDGNILNKLLRGNFITTQVILVRKDHLLEVGLFDEGLPRLQDWELWLRLAQKYKFKIINEPLVKVYFSEESISTNDSALIEAEKIILQKHYDLFKNEGSKVLAKQYYKLGHNYNLYSDVHNGRLYLKKAIKTSFNLKYILLYLLSFLGKDFYNYIQKLWIKIKHR